MSRRRWFVAATMRTSTCTTFCPPTRRNSRCSRTRNSFGLRLKRHFADLVEEDGAAGGQFEQAAARIDGAGEGALLVSEQLAFEQGLGEGGDVDGDEGLAAPGGQRMEAPRDQLLAGAGFRRSRGR